MQTATDKVTAYKDPKLPAARQAASGPGWTEALTCLAPADAEILLSAVRSLYPHDGLGPLVYRRVVLQFDAAAAATAKAAAQFAGFCALLRGTGTLPFDELSDSYREQALRQIETTAEFFFVQRMAVRYLYDDVEVWAAFGYEGASVHLGGYVKRGFDDLDWLPPLPNEI